MSIKYSQLNVQKSKNFILKNLTGQLPQGKLIAIIGPNGAGKSTFLEAIANITPIQQGKVTYNEQSLAQLHISERSKLISWVPEICELSFSFPAIEIVQMGRYPHHNGYPSKLDYDICFKIMNSFNISHLANKDFLQLSTGEKKRVMICRALACENPYIILDEPIANLDISAAFEVLKIFKGLNQEKNITIVISIHDLNLAFQFADYCVLFHNGNIIDSGETKKVINHTNIRNIFDINCEEISSSSGTSTLHFYPLKKDSL